MTAAQQLRQEGRQEGRLEGSRESRQEDILEVLAIRFGVIPSGLSEAIRDIDDDARLRDLFQKAVRCPTVDDFAARM